MNRRFVSYEKCIAYLYGLERAGIKYDLRNIKSLLKLLNHPEKNFNSVHIAGTNGKGSVSSIINSVLMEKGLHTGLYTSPHIIDFRERILVDGKFIEKKFIIDFINKMYDHIERIKPSFFEVTTSLAFDYFSFKKVDFAVIETGLGGRLDSTNILKPVASVITSIGIDHVEFLGNTIEKITREKAGIIKKNTPLIVGETSERSSKIFKNFAKKKNAPLKFSKDAYSVKKTKDTERGFYFESSGSNGIKRKMFFPVSGDYQLKNIKTAIATFDTLKEYAGINVTLKDVTRGMKYLKENSNFHGRFELISVNPKIVIDVSHNLQGIENIKCNLKYFSYNKLYIIFGMMMDKQYKECIEVISKIKATKVILTSPDYKRSATTEMLLEASSGKKNFSTQKNVEQAFEIVNKLASKKDLILVTGSFFLISDFLKIFKRRSFTNKYI